MDIFTAPLCRTMTDNMRVFKFKEFSNDHEAKLYWDTATGSKGQDPLIECLAPEAEAFWTEKEGWDQKS